MKLAPIPTYTATLTLWNDAKVVTTEDEKQKQVTITTPDGAQLASEMLDAVALLYCHGDESAAREWTRTALRANIARQLVAE